MSTRNYPATRRGLERRAEIAEVRCDELANALRAIIRAADNDPDCCLLASAVNAARKVLG